MLYYTYMCNRRNTYYIFLSSWAPRNNYMYQVHFSFHHYLSSIVQGVDGFPGLGGSDTYTTTHMSPGLSMRSCGHRQVLQSFDWTSFKSENWSFIHVLREDLLDYMQEVWPAVHEQYKLNCSTVEMWNKLAQVTHEFSGASCPIGDCMLTFVAAEDGCVTCAGFFQKWCTFINGHENHSYRVHSKLWHIPA